MNTVLTIATLGAAIRLAVPVALAALGGLVGERSGVLNLGLEGMMISGAFAGYLATDQTGQPIVGLLAGVFVGGLVGAVLALLVVVVKANQMVAGLGLTLLCTAATTYLFRTIFGIGEIPPRIARMDMPVLVAICLAVYALVWFVLTRTNVGLALSAAGDSPVAVDALGYKVDGIRTGASVVGGMLAGLVFTASYMIYTLEVFGTQAHEHVLGISPEGIGAVGALLNLVVTVVVSMLTRPPSEHVQEMVEEIRYPARRQVTVATE